MLLVISKFYEVEVDVLEDTKVVNGGGNSTVTDKGKLN